MDDAEARNVEGDLDVDLAELSLGQRLTAVTGADGTGRSPDSSDEDEAGGATVEEDFGGAALELELEPPLEPPGWSAPE